MAKTKFEYVWLDGYTPEPSLRSKTKILDLPESYDGDLGEVPGWNFDGSSTGQAEGRSSDCLLKPVAVYKDAARKRAWLVMCEVLNPDGTPHASNFRHGLPDGSDWWFGFEQEYVFMQNGKPLGFPSDGYPGPQGPYYCAVGAGNVSGREIVEEHLDLCLEAGLSITGINAEVLLGQWEYQCFGMGAKAASDALWISRYLLLRTAEQYGISISFAPKPIKGDWNGSGLHTNFSNGAMREAGGEALFKAVCEALRPVHEQHIAVYGSSNHERLTGLHETQYIGTFSYGVSDRGSSIRIPVAAIEKGWKGYLEDRRPAANADPYKITSKLVGTLAGVFEKV
ncbi:MAG: glutamine synthetase beta-grasp domain-containing protein [Bacteroidia bacterium]|nr:glutamine synthetase beta-grasp domain-containing protein [Bacteroidia bacterium]